MDAEYKTIIGGVIFMILLNIMLGFIISGDMTSGFNRDKALETITRDMNAIGGFAVGVLIGIAQAFFSLFGMNFIATIMILPWWINFLLITYNIIVLVALVFYLFRAIRG